MENRGLFSSFDETERINTCSLDFSFLKIAIIVDETEFLNIILIRNVKIENFSAR